MILDEFEVESTAFYSGSYVDNIFFGTFPNRFVIGSHSSGSNELIYTQTYSEYLSFSGSLKNRKIGIAQRFVRLNSINELYYDSLLPNILDIYNADQGKIVLAIAEHGTAPILSSTLDADIPGSAVGKLVFSTFNTSASFSGSSVSDTVWYSSYPFQLRYQNLLRNVTHTFYRSRIFCPISESISSSTGIIQYTANSNYATSSLSTAEIIIPNSQLPGLTGNASFEPIRYTMIDVTGSVSSSNELFYGRGTFLYPPTVAGTFSTISGTQRPPENEMIKLFFGFGDGYQNIPLITGVTSSFLKTATSGGINSYYSSMTNIRGWKYGLINGFPYYSCCLFRSRRYGQFRDMLEPRKYTKFFDPEDIRGIKESIVTIQFISGTETALTASLSSLNPNDSGIYDFEYKSGQPFSDL